jgi:hypothetical protein
MGRGQAGWRRPAFGLARGLTVAVHLAVLTALALWLATRSAFTHSWQVVLLLLVAGLLGPLKQAGQALAGRMRHVAGPRGPAERVGRWLRTWALSPADPLARLPAALCEALDLTQAAVALPDGDRWRVAHGHDADAWVGCFLTEPPPTPSAFLAPPEILPGVAGGVRLRLDDRLAALVLLGGKRSGEPLTPADLQIGELLVAAVAGMVGYARSQAARRRAEAEQRRLFALVTELQGAVRGRTFSEVAVHELRSALTVLLGHAELLLDGAYGPVDEPARHHIEAIHRQAEAVANSLGTLTVVFRPDPSPPRVTKAAPGTGEPL